MAAPSSTDKLVEEGRVAQPASSGVTFVACSRGIEAVPFQGDPHPLATIIQESKPFKDVYFPKESTKVRGASLAASGTATPKILQSSCSVEAVAWPSSWGLVSVIVEAYKNHHELVLRPDDVWQAILTQFSFYVNARAEDLRDRFVDFEGKKTLVVSLDVPDYASFARRMVDEGIVKSIKDPTVVEWLLPCFSTTTDADRVAASVSVMSTLQAYFDFAFEIICGIPKVTLLGTADDWRCLRAKVNRLSDYGLEGEGRVMAQWQSMLAEVLDNFVGTSAEGSPRLAFWDSVCSYDDRICGGPYLSGWVTAFAAFSHEGHWQGGGGKWPRIKTRRLPVGALSVPVLVNDMGTQYEAHLFAGQFAFERVGLAGVALQPRTDWCIAHTGVPKAEPRDYRHGEVRSTS